MYKLQVELIPPSAQNSFSSIFNTASLFSNISQSRITSLATNASLLNNESSQQNLPLQMGTSQANSPNFISSAKTKRFLHFTKPTNNLYDLSEEILSKCEKMYPDLDEQIEIINLQDLNGCDLDPDFIVKDVFNMDNSVRVIIKKDIQFDNLKEYSLYRNHKKKKLDNGTPQLTGKQQSQQLHVTKKRPSASMTKRSMSNAMRIFTPLAHQIYPPPSQSNKDIDEYNDDLSERSFLPPPNQGQFPPIRISSGIDYSKEIVSSGENIDTVSKSETVDPDKSKQQRLPSGTPIVSVMSPNRITLTGQRVVTEQSNNLNNTLFTLTSSSRKPSQTSRITSGMLRIPEPRIAEIEKELMEGPSSPASVLPMKSDRIPMKNSYEQNPTNSNSDNPSSDEESNFSNSKSLSQHQLSIANGNGSPVRNSPQDSEKFQNFNLAKLPTTKDSSSLTQRKTSLEERVQNKSSTDVLKRVEPRRIANFSDNDLDEEAEVEGEDETDEVGNDTVRISRPSSQIMPMNSTLEGTENLNIISKSILSNIPPIEGLVKANTTIFKESHIVDAISPNLSQPDILTPSSSARKSLSSAERADKKEEVKKIRLEKQAEREAAKAAKLEEANKRKFERESIKKAKEEEALKRKLEREAKQKAQREAKQKALEDAKKAKEEKVLHEKEEKEKAKIELEKKKKNAKEAAKETLLKEKENASLKSINQDIGVVQLSQDKDTKLEGNASLTKGADILKDLKAKFTGTKPRVPVGLMTQKFDRNDINNSSSELSSSDDDSSSDDSSTDDEDNSNSKKSRRMIVDTPKGPVSTRISSNSFSGVENQPQSTQNVLQTGGASQQTPNKIRITNMMNGNSSSTGNSPFRNVTSLSQGLPPKARPSLSSLSDLVSRGVPEVREKSFKSSQSRQPLSNIASNDSSSESSDEIEDSDSSESSDSGNSSDDTDGFINIKSASKKLGKKKKASGGFASLIEDSKKK